jgi:hypothetical protein
LLKSGTDDYFSLNWILVKIDRCLRHARARQNTYFRRHENPIMRTVKEIRSDFNGLINLVNIIMLSCFLIKSVFVILFISSDGKSYRVTAPVRTRVPQLLLQQPAIIQKSLVYFLLSPLFRFGFCNISKECKNNP